MTEDNSGVALGPIALQCLEMYQERQTPGITLSAMPSNNAARQAMSLHDQRATAEISAPKKEDRLARKI